MSIGSPTRELASVQISSMREDFGGQEQVLTPGKQRHGRIWLFLGR
jgi:hypothetical protein